MTSTIIPDIQITSPHWQWQYWQGLPYLTCRLLEEWQHGFFTQQFFPQTPENLVEILSPQAEVYRLKQVHGNQVLTPKEIRNYQPIEGSETEFPPGDALITEKPQQAVWVASADCTPALIGDRITGRVAAIHAGWRGTAQGILPAAIARFLNLGSRLENLYFALGPAITGEVYQVSEQVAIEVGLSIIKDEKITTPKEILEILESLVNSPILPDSHPGRVRLDIRRVNILQLEKLGIDTEQIAIAPYCTYQQPEYFFSYRRTKEKKVQWSGIVSSF